jgi:hypothetical protein
VEVTLSTASEDAGADMASLREWLTSAGDDVPWTLTPERPVPGSLGVGLVEIALVIAALDQLTSLYDRIRSWHETRHEPTAPITLTITIDPTKPRRGDHGQ